jgi:tetratricopeptide (TPR) repeat protein
VTAHLSPLEAYRRDVLRVPGRERFGEEDARWIVVAHLASSLAGRAGDAVLAASAALAERERQATSGADAADGGTVVAPELAAALDAARGGSWAPLAVAVTDAALRMEQAGAWLLAATTLSALRRAVGADAEPLLVGRAVAQWGRVERFLGAFDVARDLYDEAARLGRRHDIPELVVRAELGRAALARARGNYPEARAGFQRGLRRAERHRLGELTGLAHQGLLIAAAVARDFDTALVHGWAALAQVAGEPTKEAPVLSNLATVCLDAHEDEAALRGYQAAAVRTRDVRTWLSATSGAAAAAGRLGRRDLVDAYAAAVERALASEDTPYERAWHLLTLSDAYRDLGVAERSAAYWERGIALARAHGFAELEHEYAEPRVATSVATPPAVVPAATPIGAGGRRVVRAISALPSGVGVGSAPSSGPAEDAGEDGEDDAP